MNDLVQLLNEHFYQLSIISVGASLLWGLLSVFLSPCHVASIPLIIGYVNNREIPDSKNGFLLSLLFGLGILSMLVVMGIVTGLLGRILGDVGTPIMVAVYIFLLLCGIWLLDIPVFANLNLSFFQQNPRMKEMGAYTLGFLYGLVLGPCSFAFMAPMIGIVFTQSMTRMGFGILLFILYGIGHTAAIVIAGTAGSKVGKLFESGKMENISLWIKRLCGAFIIFYTLFKIWDFFK